MLHASGPPTTPVRGCGGPECRVPLLHAELPVEMEATQTEDVLEVRHFFCTGLPSPVPPALLPRLKMIGTTPFEDLYFLPCPQAVAAKLDLPDDLIGYFSLFLVREK